MEPRTKIRRASAEFLDRKSLIDQLIEIFTDDELRKKMSKESLNIIAKHDIEETMQKFEDIYIAAIDMKKK